MSAKRPAFQFYPADWRKDAALQSCSIAARGLWHEMLCIMHECEPYGHLTVNGKPMAPAQLGRLVGISSRETSKLLAELFQCDVFSKTEEGAIYSRRMVRDEAVRNARAAGGQSGGKYGNSGGEHGRKGGRPKKADGGLKTPLDGDSKGGSETPLPNTEKPPPSSSSSPSPSVSENSSSDTRLDAAREIMTAFDRQRVAAFGEQRARPWPAAMDRSFALRWLEAGADLALCEGVFTARFQRQKATGKPPSDTLEHMDQPIANALAAKDRPMPPPDQPRQNGTAADPPKRQNLVAGSPEDERYRREVLGLDLEAFEARCRAERGEP